LSWKLKTLKYRARFIELADDINRQMPEYIVSRVALALNDHERALKNAKVLVIGVAYKRDINDDRESPSLDVIEQLEKHGARVAYHDPHIPHVSIDGRTYASVALTPERVRDSDVVIISTDHTSIDYGMIVDHATLVFDSRNALRTAGVRPNIVRL
jgi:UDP-N-acetyl-D-glucosamine dehydrogenase